MPTIVLVDAMAGVRDGLRWVLRDEWDITIVGEAGTVADAAAAAADVILTGVHLPDGDAADVASRTLRPVVVHTWMPPDERDPSATKGAAAVVCHGALRDELAAAITRAWESARG